MKKCPLRIQLWYCTFITNKPKQMIINQKTRRVYKHEKPLEEAYYKCYMYFIRHNS